MRLNNRWNAGYVECFNHLKRLLPLPAAIAEQRLSILAIYSNAVLSAHEAALESRNTRNSRLWGQPFTIENILDMLEAAITGPPSQGTLAKLQGDGRDARSRSTCQDQPVAGFKFNSACVQGLCTFPSRSRFGSLPKTVSSTSRQ